MQTDHTGHAARLYPRPAPVVSVLQSRGFKPEDFASTNASTDAGVAVTQKFITVGQERIAYFETTRKGPDVLLIHGSSQSSNSFERQLNSPLGRVFHIISIDLPGHGASDRSPTPSVTCQVPGYASVVVDVAKALHMEHGVLVENADYANTLLAAFVLEDSAPR